MSDLPNPLVPADVDLRDFGFMPIDIVRLFGSGFHAQSTDGEWRAGVTLWLRSYHQVPAGSLPDDEIALTRLAELGRDVKSWRKIRSGALHGWTKCSDGRLYHHTVGEKVLEGWIEKLTQRKSSAAGNAKRYGHVFDPCVFDDAIEASRLLLNALNPQSRVLAKRGGRAPSRTPTDPPAGSPDGTPTDLPKHSQGTGTGTGKGQVREHLKKEYCPKPVRTRNAYPADFIEFWSAYPTDRNMGKREAFDAWKKLSDEERRQAIASCPSFVRHCKADSSYRPLHANRYLAKRRFEGHAEPGASHNDCHRVDFGGGVIWPETSVKTAITRWRTDPTTWPTDHIGPPPDDPGCRVPEHLLKMAA